MSPETAQAPQEAKPRKKNRRGRDLTPEQASEMGKKGGRPPGSISKAKRKMIELAECILTDLTVQQRMLADAQAGLLHPSVIRELLYIYNGRPAYKMERVIPVDPEEDEERARLRAMPKDKRRMMLDLMREMDRQPLALPASAVRVVNATDAVLTPQGSGA